MSQTVTEKPNMVKKVVKPCKPLNPGDSTQQVCLDLVKGERAHHRGGRGDLEEGMRASPVAP